MNEVVEGFCFFYIIEVLSNIFVSNFNREEIEKMMEKNRIIHKM